MNIPEWFKPGLKGAAALAIVGFTWGGWVTGGTAKEMASDQAKLEVVAALVPICIQQSSQDPQVVETLGHLREASSYQRSDESRLGHDAGFKRAQSQRREGVHKGAGSPVLTAWAKWN